MTDFYFLEILKSALGSSIYHYSLTIKCHGQYGLTRVIHLD